MQLRHDLHYASSPDGVLAMMLEPAFWDRVAGSTGALSSTTTVEGTAAGTSVVTREVQPMAGVPAFARRIAGETTDVVKRLTWQGFECSVVIESPGKPTSLSGSATLAADGEGTRLTYDLDARASVPLLGNRLEKLVVQLTTDGMDTEHAVGVAWLRGER